MSRTAGPLPPLLLLLAATACTVTRVPPAVRPLAAPLPLAVALCGPADSLLTAPFGGDGVLFARVTAAAAGAAGDERLDLVARVRTTAPAVRWNRTSVGFFLWTLAIVPAAHHEVTEVTVELQRAAAGADPCAAADAPALALTTTAREPSLSGWVPQLVLRPTPWWREVPDDGPAQRASLAGHARAEVARLVEARRGEIMALAGR